MKRLEQAQLWIMIIIGAIGTIVMVTYGSQTYGENFMPDFMSNWYSTFLGVIVGIPFALWMSNFQEKATEGERKKKILRLLKEELLLNFGTLTRYEKQKTYVNRAVYLQTFLKTENWRAFSDGGELQWIKDPVLLSTMAETYNMIRMVLTLSDRYLELLSLVDKLSDSTKQTCYTDVMEYLDQGVCNVMHEITQTLKVIEKAEKV